jgi:hypothetical protein
MNAKTLVEEIIVCMQSGSPNHEVVRLGGEYISLCEYTKKRLIRCIDFIRQGKEFTALQEAQFSPPLMTSLEALSFTEQDDWRKELKRNGLRVPSYFDDKHISMMCDLFSKEIDGTDPLYSELAHAMRQKDKDSALNVLRIIHHKNPKDTNAEKQLGKVEKIIQQKRIDELTALVKERDEQSFKNAISAFRDEPWNFEPVGGDWSAITKYELKLIKVEKLEQCKGMVEHLCKMQKENSLEHAISSLKQIDLLVTENDLSLDETFEQSDHSSYNDGVRFVREWINAERKKRQIQADAKNRENNLKIVVRSIQDKQIGRRRKIEELRKDLARLTAVGRDLEQEGQSLPESDLSTFNQCLSNLRNEIAQRQKSLRLKISTSCLLGVIVISLSFFLVSERLQWNEEFEILSNGIKANRNVEDLEVFLNSFETKYAERLVDIEFDSKIQKSRSLISNARSFNAEMGEKIKVFLQDIAQADDLKRISNLFGRKKLLWEDLNRLNIAYLDMRKAQLNEVDLSWNQQRDKLQAKVSQVFAEKLSEASLFAKEELEMDIDPTLLEANLIQFNQMLIHLETESEKYAQVEGLGLSSGQKDLLSSLRKSYQKKKQALQSYESVLSELANANSVDSYLVALNKIVKSGLTGTPHYKPAQKILLAKSFFTEGRARRFMPDSPQYWKSAKASINSRYIPKQFLAQEVAVIQKIVDEERTKNIYSSAFHSSENEVVFDVEDDCWFPVPKDSPFSLKWTRGKDYDISMDFRRGTGYGSYLVTQKANVVSGTQVIEQSFESTWSGITKSFTSVEPPVRVRGQIILGGALNNKKSVLSAESGFLHGKKSSFVKAFPLSKAKESPLLFLDSLKEEEIDPLIKAHVFLEVFKSISFRPNEWGLKNNPNGNLTIEDSYKKLIRLTGGKDLIASWYNYLSTGKETSLRNKLLEFFKSESEKSYFQEAKFYEKFWSEIYSTNFKFKGYCKLDRSWSDSLSDDGWALKDEKDGLRLVRQDKDEVLPLSPILTLDREPISILKKAFNFAEFETVEQLGFVQIKETLPYPFKTLPMK